jgi:aspartate/methionine/tyrosine aminotransferase
MKAVPELVDRVNGLSPSPTVEMTERVRAARVSGEKIFGLSSGDPNLPTHPAVMEAAGRAMKEGDTHYGPSAGKPSLREALADLAAGESVGGCDREQVLVTPGGKFAVLVSILAMVGPGDEVIILDPAWVSYAPCVHLAGGTPVFVPALEGVDIEYLAAAVTPRTRLIIVNSPVNPTGRVIPRTELEAITALAVERNLWLLYDEVYRELVFSPARHTPILSIPGAAERTFVVNSFSKTYGMTGWRVGSLICPPGTSRAVLKVIQHSVYCVPPFVQTAAEAALLLPKKVVSEQVAVYRKRQDLAVGMLKEVPGVTCHPPQATFYLFPAVEGDDRDVANLWLDKAGVAVLPGSAFGEAGRGHLRLSLTSKIDTIEESIKRVMSLMG